MNDIRRKVLSFFLGGYGVRDTARHVKLSPARVGQIASEFTTSGVLVNAAPKGAPAHFVKGPNFPGGLSSPLDSTSDQMTVGTVGGGLDDLDLEMIGGPSESGFIPMRIHSLGHRFEVETASNNGVPWTRETSCSGVATKILEIPYSEDPYEKRLIKVVLRDGRDRKCLEVWTPEVVITNPAALQNFPSWAAMRAQRVANWLCRTFGFKLGLMEMCQDFHFAAALPTEVAQAAKQLGLKTPDVWVDTSRGRGEYEMKDAVTALGVMTSAARLDSLERELQPSLAVIAENQAKLAEGQLGLAKAVEDLTSTLKRLMGPEKIAPIDRTDPGGMFG